MIQHKIGRWSDLPTDAQQETFRPGQVLTTDGHVFLNHG